MFEVFLQSEGDYLNWTSDYIKNFYRQKHNEERLVNEPDVLSLDQQRAKVIDEIKQSFTGLFDMVAIDKKIRESSIN